jgi:hypothetical protein
MMSDRIPRLTLFSAMVLCGGLAWRPAPGDLIPTRMPLSETQPWMADALVGVGAKSRDQVAQQLRAQHLSSLPARARAMVPVLFIVPDQVGE